VNHNSQAYAISLVALVLVGALVGGCKSPQMQTDATKACIDARTALLHAADSEDITTRANAMEAMAQVYGQQAGQVFMQALVDPSPAVRFAAAMAIGDVRYRPAAPQLVKMVEDKQLEPDKRVLVAAVYALYMLGDERHVSTLGELLFDRESEVRADVAMVMGKMGERSAIDPLKMLLPDEQDPAVQLQVVEALARLGDERSMTLLEAYTKTQFVDEQLVAIPAMVNANSPRAGIVLRTLMRNERQPPRVRVTAAGGLAKLGQVTSDGYEMCLIAAREPRDALREAFGAGREITPVEVFSLQRLAAISLGSMEEPLAVDVLHPLLGSADGGVRIAAAMGILRILSMYCSPGDELAPAQPSESPAQPEGDSRRPRLHTVGGKD